ncbi:hypothetical protein U9M48_030032 [Paspalum notatum var. saurae]|uniref:Uncharacterized protein n=1 Tax=Paspalum notatum var. saurae TaxID=547442 RepID=A0AAQ3X1Q9_PASNO
MPPLPHASILLLVSPSTTAGVLLSRASMCISTIGASFYTIGDRGSSFSTIDAPFSASPPTAPPKVSTRFRPLSLNVPKPLFPLAGQPMVHHPIFACRRLVSWIQSLQIPNLAQIYLIGFYEEQEFALYMSRLSPTSSGSPSGTYERISLTGQLESSTALGVISWRTVRFVACSSHDLGELKGF